VSTDDAAGLETSKLREPQQFAFNAVSETLGKSTDVDSCVQLATRIDELMTQALEYFRKEGAGIACRSGCTFCCHLRVMVHPHEAIALFRYLGSRLPAAQAAEVRRRLIENAAEISQGHAFNRSCAFLVDGKCSAYAVRPSACSGYHSLSREQCEKQYEGGGTPSVGGGEPSAGIPVLQALEHVAAGLDGGIEQALAALDLSGARVELHTAVAALIRDPALTQRWRAGRTLIKDAC